MDPVGGGCHAEPHPSVTGHSLSGLISSALCRQHSIRSSNLGSSGEDLSVCPGAQVLFPLIQLKKKKKEAVFLSVGCKTPALFNEAAAHCGC